MRISKNFEKNPKDRIDVKMNWKWRENANLISAPPVWSQLDTSQVTNGSPSGDF